MAFDHMPGFVPSTAFSQDENRTNPTNSPWRDSKNRWYTYHLFYEFAGEDKSLSRYTIYELDRVVGDVTYKSLKDMYVLADHIPGYEYDFANTYFGGWEHWKRLQNSTKQIKELIQSWRDELEIRLKAQAAKDIINCALSESGATRLNANKWLSDKGWLPQKGRPKKEDIQRETKIAAGVEKDIEDDLARIRLVK